MIPFHAVFGNPKFYPVGNEEYVFRSFGFFYLFEEWHLGIVSGVLVKDKF
jgi:hypothetical protein